MSSKTSAPPIKPIDFDVAKRAVDEFALERNVPSQVYPHSQFANQPSPRTADASAPSEVPKPPPVSEQKFTVELPEYVIDEIHSHIAASKPRKTRRYLILEALRGLGIHVQDEDMILDRRRTSPR